MDFYVVSFKYKKNSCYSIWFTDKSDGFLTHENQIMLWSSLADLCKYANQNNIVVCSEQMVQYDLDEKEMWIQNKKYTTSSCNDILDFWNICSDAANSINLKFEGDDVEADLLYDKIFYGSNLKTINNTEKIFIPTLDERELALLESILTGGLRLLIRHCRRNGSLDNPQTE